jgi:hypothetical protein
MQHCHDICCSCSFGSWFNKGTNLGYADFISKLLDRITADDRLAVANLFLFVWLFGAGLFVVGNWWMCNGSCANSRSCLWRLSRYARIILPLFVFKIEGDSYINTACVTAGLPCGCRCEFCIPWLWNINAIVMQSPAVLVVKDILYCCSGGNVYGVLGQPVGKKCPVPLSHLQRFGSFFKYPVCPWFLMA